MTETIEDGATLVDAVAGSKMFLRDALTTAIVCVQSIENMGAGENMITGPGGPQVIEVLRALLRCVERGAK